jgi:hypothetical protein
MSRITRRALFLGLPGLAAITQRARADGGAIPIVPGTSLGIVPQGGASGGDALYLNGGDIIGPRNLQGGGPGGQSFDIGAGSTEDPGDVVLNYDIGRNVLIYDGHKRLVARLGAGGIVFYQRPKIRRRP